MKRRRNKKTSAEVAYAKANRLNNLALELERKGDKGKAIECYKKAISLAPKWASPYYNLGLLYKHQADWKNSLHYNEIATGLDADDQPGWWNMGIAATALSEWEKAKKAWTGFGIETPDLQPDGEFIMQLGITPVRLKANNEVVWTKRIDPARAVIDNIPTQESNRRFRDVVLNDGEPVGYRKYNGQSLPVLNELKLWKASAYRTYSLWLENAELAQVEALEIACRKEDIACENWTGTIRRICKKCSEGTPHEHHDLDFEKRIETGEYNVAVAALPEVDLDTFLEKMKAELLLQIVEMERVI